MALFPAIDPALKTPDGQEARNPDGLIPRVVRALKKEFPTWRDDRCGAGPFTSHGQDGVLDETGCIINDQTVEILTAQALTHAEAGVDIVAPSDMMDGRIGAIREALEVQGHIHTRIMAYSAKYASAFYGPSATRWEPVAPGQELTRTCTRWTRQQRRSPREVALGCRRRGHGDGQTRHAVPGHRAPREGRIRACPPSPTRSAASTP